VAEVKVSVKAFSGYDDARPITIECIAFNLSEVLDARITFTPIKNVFAALTIIQRSTHSTCNI
jgi:hypothetical protein